eukprot:980976-Lingulodinium_polyedra.AAC.1
MGLETQSRDVCHQSAATAALGSLVVLQDQQPLGGLIRDVDNHLALGAGPVVLRVAIAAPPQAQRTANAHA